MSKFYKQKNSGFTRLVDFGDAIPSRTKGASPKLTTGFTLVEALVAISIFTTSILGLMTILGSGISDTNYAKNKITAEYLAQEGIEYVRNLRDTSVLYNAGGAKDGWNAFRDLIDSQITPPAPDDTNFSREIRKIGIGADEVTITSIVTWTQGARNYSITFSENLFNWIE